jgi:GcrA cell cycle regulator
MGQNWTDEKLLLLKKLWTGGETAGAIAPQLGVSRSAVLGRIFRLRLARPAQKSKRAVASSPAHRRKGRRSEVSAPNVSMPNVSIKRGKTLLELTNESCRWPIGDPSTKRFHFCGEPGADLEQGIPYCERHRRRAYNRPKQSEADRAQNAGRDGSHRFAPAMQTTVQRLFRVAVARRVRT